jgi:hypothetical protein
MGDLCLNLSAVKPNFLPAAKALDKNGDGQVCQSENPLISTEDFQDFVSLASKPVVKGEKWGDHDLETPTGQRWGTAPTKKPASPEGKEIAPKGGQRW